MKYRKLYDWKYEIAEDITRQTKIIGYEFDHPFFSLRKNGMMTLKAGYKWNGANVVPDADSIMEGSAFHDALYQMGRRKVISDDCKLLADMLLYEICVEKGMSDWLANWVFAGVNVGGESCWREESEQDKETVYEV
jgi:hypothetical protein